MSLQTQNFLGGLMRRVGRVARRAAPIVGRVARAAIRAVPVIVRRTTATVRRLVNRS